MQPLSAILSQVRLSNPYISLTRSIRLIANNTHAPPTEMQERPPPCVSGLPASQWTPSKCEPESSHPGQRQLWSAQPSIALEVLHNGHRQLRQAMQADMGYLALIATTWPTWSAGWESTSMFSPA
ncbi:hypothetical protein J1614_006660 [Plenodomus biglobosus]|nr:hypothetical protein J1614_006660 [Plenodomus biglobosus]